MSASASRAGPPRPLAGTPPHALLVAVALALPLLGLALLVAAPDLDVTWEHHPSHFWMVLSAGGLTAALAYATCGAARRRGDARVLLVSLGFLAAAGFLGLHALATPGVLLDETNTGFAMATPVGLLIAAGFAAASSLDLPPPRAAALMARARLLRAALLALLALWAVLSLGGLPPLDDPSAPERTSGALVSISIVAIGLYAVAVARYLPLARRGRTGVLVWMAIAFVLLAEAMTAVAIGRNWHATWWEWHLLMLVAFALVAWSAHREWHEERFSDLYLDQTADGTRDLSVLFADLQGFTTFSETHEPREVTAMLNEYFGVAIPPIVHRHGGDVDRIVGDALMATFNRRGDQPDHPARAARAALELQDATGAIAAEHPGWPRFRAAVNTGEVALSVLGTTGGRTHTAIGDTVNLAARLEAAAPVGGVALGGETARRLAGALTEPLGPLRVKGKAEPVEAHRLLALEEER